jgi:hypothetical protein
MFFEEQNKAVQQTPVDALIKAVEELPNKTHLETLKELEKKAKKFDEILNHNMSDLDNYNGDNEYLISLSEGRQLGNEFMEKIRNNCKQSIEASDETNNIDNNNTRWCVMS